jgi:amidase
MSIDELCTKGAVELAAMIRARQVTSREVLDAHLARIEEVNPSLNAVTVTLADEARAAAAAVDRAVAAGATLGPLAGVPITIKENIDVAGSARTWGVAAFADQIVSADAPMVARLREAGAIPFARTNLPDFAFRWDTMSGRAGRTRNPWDPARTAGGSSGGEAAALASGITPLGLGNDLGGSVRVPSQMCGTAAIRADVAALVPGMRKSPAANRSSSSRRAWRRECSSPSTRRRSMKRGSRCISSARRGRRSSKITPSSSRRYAASVRG